MPLKPLSDEERRELWKKNNRQPKSAAPKPSAHEVDDQVRSFLTRVPYTPSTPKPPASKAETRPTPKPKPTPKAAPLPKLAAPSAEDIGFAGPPAPVRLARPPAPKPPAASSINISVALDEVAAFLRRYVVISSEQAVALALWTCHSHAVDAADATPYISVTSACMRCGKSRLLDCLEPLVAKPWKTCRTSAAALVRKIDSDGPTLLLDESDTAFGADKEYAEALRGVLNAGYRRGGKASLCIGQGGKIEVRDFDVYGCKCVAGIGKLPNTVKDRSIGIVLKRRRRDEDIARWRERDGFAEAAPLHKALAAWTAAAMPMLREARPRIPQALNDRLADVWEPLLAISDLAGDTWPARARDAAVALASDTQDDDIRVQLLTDLVPILADTEADTEVIRTADILAELVRLEARPWATWRKDEKPLTARAFARLLEPLGIYPAHTEHGNGYRVIDFNDAINRYVPSLSTEASQPSGKGQAEASQPSVESKNNNDEHDDVPLKPAPAAGFSLGQP